MEAHDRKRLEQLCRYIARPALLDEWVQPNAAGQVELKFKTPWSDITTHLVMSQLEFMQRLAALAGAGAAHATDRFAATNLGGLMPGLGRFHAVAIPGGAASRAASRR